MKILLLIIAATLSAAEAVPRISDPLLNECSGVVASRAHPGVLWCHNDSGHLSELFAIDKNGVTLARIPVAIVTEDWEDIAIDAHSLYLADIGDNRCNRPEVRVHLVAEPNPRLLAYEPMPVKTTWRLRYPDQPHDAEALVIDGSEGFIIDKRLGYAHVWRFRLDGPTEQVLEPVVTLAIPAPVTGADLSLDGKWLALSSPFGVHLVPLPAGIRSADALNALTLRAPLELTREAVSFGPGGLFAGSELRELRSSP